MSLNHHFYLLDSHKLPLQTSWITFTGVTDGKIHDNLFGYMSDTLRWIPTINPTGGISCNGFCRQGITVVDKTGASVAMKIFSAWASLFEPGPEVLRLHNPVFFESNPSMNRFELKKIDVVQSLNLIAGYFKMVSENDNLYVLHYGI